MKIISFFLSTLSLFLLSLSLSTLFLYLSSIHTHHSPWSGGSTMPMLSEADVEVSSPT